MDARPAAIRLTGLKKRYGTGEAAVDALKGVTEYDFIVTVGHTEALTN